MHAGEISELIADKDSDPEALVARITEIPGSVSRLLEGLSAGQPRLRYGCEKALRLVGQRRPELLYPHFDVFSALLDSPNSFLKWGAILTIANLAVVDTGSRIEGLLDRYLAALSCPAMITAANTVRGAAMIARAKPALADRIAQAILSVEYARYESRGVPSPECTRVVCGHALKALTEIFPLLQDGQPVIDFAHRQLESSRAAVRRKAGRFLDRVDPGR